MDFFVLFVMLCPSPTGSHTLQYYISMVSVAAPGLPQYSITAFVDDVMIGRYSSDTRDIETFVPVPEILSWHVRRKMEYAFHLEEEEKKGLEKVMVFSNMTYGSADIHVYQKKFICELDDDGSVGGYQEAAFDGESFATFDKEKGVFVPLTQKASDVIQQCANCDLYAKSDKFYMENYCIHDLKLYLPYLIKMLDKKVCPKVKISSLESDNNTKLHCCVYGFHPREVDVKWIKNGRDEIHSEEAPQILPNPDGTYQIRVSVGVTPEGGATYSCHIDHSSLNDTLVVPFLNDTKHRGVLYIIIPVFVAFVLLTAVLGVVLWRNRKDNRGITQSDSPIENV